MVLGPKNQPHVASSHRGPSGCGRGLLGQAWHRAEAHGLSADGAQAGRGGR